MKNPVPYVVDASHSPHALFRPVPLDAVRLSDEFWEPRRRTNAAVTLLSQFAHLESTGCLDNFRRVYGKTEAPFRGPYFADSDLYKWLEAASSALLGRDVPGLKERIDEAISVIEGAQKPDGYLNTYFSCEREGERFTNLRDLHEMYCAGHLIQAAAAHHRATGSERLLTVARGVADNLCATFGPAEEGKIFGTDGHPEIEMALVELARATGEARYTEQARFFVEARGRVPGACYRRKGEVSARPGDVYCQDHIPFRDLADVTGHAVRMLYLSCGAADLYLETGDTSLKAALDRQWENMTTRRMYVSGGLGARWEGEAFGTDYELPNERAYTETCAAIASVMWNYRMLLATGESRYADLMEWTLYNAVLPGLSRDGEHYFYQNPLADDGAHRRRAWFGCACCPPNVARLLAQLPGYFYCVSDAENAVAVNLYASGTARLVLPDNRTVKLTTQTRYPWDGDIAITVNGEGDFRLDLRIPEWCSPSKTEAAATLTINGEPWPGAAAEELRPGSFIAVRRDWRPGDRVHLHLPMPVRRLECHPAVTENAGRIALTRGPLLYCLEGADHGETDLRSLSLGTDAPVSASFQPGLLGGIVTLSGPAWAAASWEEGDEKSRRLYTPVARDAGATGVAKPPAFPIPFTAIPYYAWANREPGRLLVWVRSGSGAAQEAGR